jgi:hypothetical protein
MTPIEIGIIDWVAVAGRPIYKSSFQEDIILEIAGSLKEIIFFLLSMVKEKTKVKALAITVAIAAPFNPKEGIGPKPNIKIGSKIKFRKKPYNIILLGDKASPVERIILFPTIGMITKGTPKNQICI